MDATEALWFWVVDLLLVLTPGADWAYVVTAAVRDRTPAPAVAGLVTGYAGHTVLVVAGLAALVATTPGALTALTAAGAGYLVVLGVLALARPAVPDPADGDGPAAGTPGRRLLRGAGVSGLNPKGLLLYLAVLPQFLDPAAPWPVAAQTGVLGAVHLLDCTVVYAAVAALARRLLATRPRAARTVTRVAGVTMLAIAVALLAERLS